MYTAYTVYYYVNGECTSSLKDLGANSAYQNAVPGEALQQNPGSRWHVMMRGHALEKMGNLLEGESVRICWQDPPLNNGLDTEHILIVKQERSLANTQDYSNMNNYTGDVEFQSHW